MKEKRVFDLKDKFDPSIIKNMSYSELENLSSEVRKQIIEACSINGGHLSSNLGTVELTVALFNALNLPQDKVIFDVGHQSYAYKILSGRKLDNLRKENGIDGFQKRSESEFDHYEAGHSSTSIGAGMGMALTRDLNKENYRVVCVIGDSSLSNGVSFEALNNLSNFKHKLLIILNDNEMSITTPVGGFNQILQKIRVTKRYVSGKNKYKEVMKKNKFLRFIYKISSKVKDWIVNLMYRSNLFEEFGLYYYGVIDGHNVKKMIRALNKVKDIDGPVLLHVKTTKGKGYSLAEGDKTGSYHSVQPFDKETGKKIKECDKSKETFAQIYARLLEKSMDRNEKIISINPATSYGSSLDKLMKKYPSRALDVGISEEHAIVFASGIAVNSYHPYVTIYSTFLQRSYDEISHDVCRMDLPVTLMVDHSGLVGSDGETHQGIYDFSYLSSIPNMTIAMAKDSNEANRLFNFSLEYTHPFAIRYPVGLVSRNEYYTEEKIKFGQWDVYSGSNKNVCVITFGPKVDEILNKKLDITVVNAIFNYPLNENVLASLLDYKNIIVYDPYGTEIGFSLMVENKLHELNYLGTITKVSLPHSFIKKGTVLEQEKRHNVDVENLISIVEKM